MFIRSFAGASVLLIRICHIGLSFFGGPSRFPLVFPLKPPNTEVLTKTGRLGGAWGKHSINDVHVFWADGCFLFLQEADGCCFFCFSCWPRCSCSFILAKRPQAFPQSSKVSPSRFPDPGGLKGRALTGPWTFFLLVELALRFCRGKADPKAQAASGRERALAGARGRE